MLLHNQHALEVDVSVASQQPRVYCHPAGRPTEFQACAQCNPTTHRSRKRQSRHWKGIS
jgi:hypothetical protein